MTKTQMMKLLSTSVLVLTVMFLISFILFYPAPTRADEVKHLEWKVNDNVSVLISNAKCVASFKDKYPYMALALDKQTRTILKGCFTKFDDNLIVIHWEGTPDTTEYNATVPANMFLTLPENNSPKKQAAPEDKGIDI